MSSVNCSYSYVNGTFVTQFCTSSGQPYCCQSSGTKYCTDSDCTDDTSASVDVKTIAFWGILGGLLLLCIIIVVLVYILCYQRQPAYGCFSHNPMEELLETTIQEVHTVRSETHVTGNNMAEPTVVRRTEEIRKVITKQQSRSNLFKSKTMEPVTIRVSPSPVNGAQATSSKQCREEVKLVADGLNTGNKRKSTVSFRPGQFQTTSIGNTGFV